MNKQIAEEESKIANLNKYLKSEKWERDQNYFSKTCYELSEKYLPGYGRYSYDIPFVKFDTNGKQIPGNYKVWQIFYSSTCLEDLDYSCCPRYKYKSQIMNLMKYGHSFYRPNVYNDIEMFIREIYVNCCKDDNNLLSVIFNYSNNWNNKILEKQYDFLYKNLSDNDNNGGLFCYDTSLFEYKDCNDIIDRVIVIVDFFTENFNMKRLCQKIISSDCNFQPLILYISLMKVFDREEMIAIIEREKERQEKGGNEKEKEQNVKKSLVESVFLWDRLFCGLRYKYLFYYYPTTCEFEANEDELYNRRIIWNFKNNPGSISSATHRNTLNKVIPMIMEELLSTFSGYSLKYLTLVCIPASSQAKTKARYEEFSSLICEESGMINAYPHITVTEERLEKHLGGTNTDTDKLSFDEDFFKGKYVLLFDDIITSGDSMRTFQRKIEALGATVVGGLCLGKTKHERPIPPHFSF